jgi:hypothetical protein
MPDYGNPSYWDERYAAENAVFDWYQDYREVCSGKKLLFKQII